jgi:hypothetical protein
VIDPDLEKYAEFNKILYFLYTQGHGIEDYRLPATAALVIGAAIYGAFAKTAIYWLSSRIVGGSVSLSEFFSVVGDVPEGLVAFVGAIIPTALTNNALAILFSVPLLITSWIVFLLDIKEVNKPKVLTLHSNLVILGDCPKIGGLVSGFT